MVDGDDPDQGEKERRLSTVEVTEIRDPEDAYNDRDNPEVEVTVHSLDAVLEQYCFEFVHPRHNRMYQEHGEEYRKYGYGLHVATEGAKESENRNKAMFKAAEALADHTGTPVELIAYPTDDLVDEREYPDENE